MVAPVSHHALPGPARLELHVPRAYTVYKAEVSKVRHLSKSKRFQCPLFYNAQMYSTSRTSPILLQYK